MLGGQRDRLKARLRIGTWGAGLLLGGVLFAPAAERYSIASEAKVVVVGRLDRVRESRIAGGWRMEGTVTPTVVLFGEAGAGQKVYGSGVAAAVGAGGFRGVPQGGQALNVPCTGNVVRGLLCGGSRGNVDRDAMIRKCAAAMRSHLVDRRQAEAEELQGEQRRRAWFDLAAAVNTAGIAADELLPPRRGGDGAEALTGQQGAGGRVEVAGATIFQNWVHQKAHPPNGQAGVCATKDKARRMEDRNGRIHRDPRRAHLRVHAADHAGGGVRQPGERGVVRPDAAASGRSAVRRAWGMKIALAADGVAVAEVGSPVFQLRENVTLTTNHAEYAWVNPIQVWAAGTVDLSRGEILVKGYAA